MTETKAIFSYFADWGEVLWFKGHPALEDQVITQPAAFVKSLRTVITHKVQDKFKGVKYEENMQDLLKRGCLSFGIFREVYDKEKQGFSAREAWMFMKELGLAFPIESLTTEEATEENETVMIPCLINDSMEKKVKQKEQEMELSHNSVCFLYKFDRNKTTLSICKTLVKVFTEKFLGKNGGSFDLAYSQKIEKRRLGTVGGIQGTLKWTHSKSCIQEPKVYSFLLLEHESTVGAFDLQAKPYALNRGLKFHIQPREGELTEEIFAIAEKMDTAFSAFLPVDVQRSISCKECLNAGIPGYFPVHSGFQLKTDNQICSEVEHFFDKKLAALLKKKEEPFEMKNLLQKLNVEKSSFDLMPFEDSTIKKDMLSGKLEAGEQIWIYHDSETNPWNLMARLNPYAHVVVFVGQTNGIHEVVHIGSAFLTKGLMKAKIRKQNVLDVIKPRDYVFLGHKIPNCQVSANVRQEIVKRALKCTEKPSIVFDYHYR